MKDQEKEFNGFDHNTDHGASENENSSAPTKENMNDNPKDSFSVLVKRLDTCRTSSVKSLVPRLKLRVNVTKKRQRKYPLGMMKRLSFCKIK